MQTPTSPSKQYKPIHGGYPGNVPKPRSVQQYMPSWWGGGLPPRFTNDERFALI